MDDIRSVNDFPPMTLEQYRKGVALLEELKEAQLKAHALTEKLYFGMLLAHLIPNIFEYGPVSLVVKEDKSQSLKSGQVRECTLVVSRGVSGENKIEIPLTKVPWEIWPENAKETYVKGYGRRHREPFDIAKYVLSRMTDK